MSAGNIKKLYILYILNVLKKYSDYEHRLTQKDIISHIRTDYGVECERKAIARNIGDLIDFGYDIEQDGGNEIKRGIGIDYPAEHGAAKGTLREAMGEHCRQLR